jgi:uncharacterized protein YndB with AHSA1/START domain
MAKGVELRSLILPIFHYDFVLSRRGERRPRQASDDVADQVGAIAAPRGGKPLRTVFTELIYGSPPENGSCCGVQRRRTLLCAPDKVSDPARPSYAASGDGRVGAERATSVVCSRATSACKPQGEETMPNTVRLHRVLATTPEKLYRAFIEPDALAKWLPPNGFVCTVHRLEPKVGGAHRASFRNFTTGESHAFGGEFLELSPNERLRYTDRFDDPNMPGEIHVTVMIKKVSVGAELSIVQEGVPDVIPPEACYLGWQESLENLARLVEPEISG